MWRGFLFSRIVGVKGLSVACPQQQSVGGKGGPDSLFRPNIVGYGMPYFYKHTKQAIRVVAGAIYINPVIILASICSDIYNYSR